MKRKSIENLQIGDMICFEYGDFGNAIKALVCGIERMEKGVFDYEVDCVTESGKEVMVYFNDGDLAHVLGDNDEC